VTGHLAAARRGVNTTRELGQHDFARAHAKGDQRCDRPVVRHHPVEALAQWVGHANLRALVALAADDERDLAGPIEHPHALIDGTRDDHQPVHLQQVVAR
jgi:hypothetical protein